MRIFVSGATGFVGSAACLRLSREGHQVVAWVRDLDAARARLGAEVELLSTRASDAVLAETLAECDAVLNLAGAPVAKRWTRARRAAIVRSRVDLTRRIVDAMASASRSPQALISASAIGVYGDRGDAILDAESPPASGFLAEVCRDWESEARRAESQGVRVAVVRIGVVLGREGGALATMRPLFARGLGGRLGSGHQWMSWIHLDDLLELFIHALGDPSIRGVLEGVAPNPVRNDEFTATLARALGRRVGLTVPAPALRLAFGGAAEVMLASQRVVPRRTLASGFRFAFRDVDAALAELEGPPTLTIASVSEGPDSNYLRDRPVRHRLEQVIEIDRPIDEVFEFFERPENLGPLTPPTLSFDIVTPSPVPMHEGSIIDYRIRLSGVPMRWRTRIDAYAPGVGRPRFVDVQLRGPYAAWHHEHRFEPTPRGGTRVHDIVHYAVPLGPLGRLVHRWFVAPQLRRIFEFRARAIGWRFGAPGAGDTRAAA